MNPHISGYLEPLIGEASCFDTIDIQDNRTSNERTLKIVLEIEKLRHNFIDLLNITVKSLKNG